MRKIAIIALMTSLSAVAGAQNVREEVRQDIRKAGCNYYVYPAPTERHTPAPKGKKPFYLSHYGRHGSRYLIHDREYNYPFATLYEADQQGKLSEAGKTALERITLLRNEASGRLGELTPLGALQHREIARRMFERYPEVFKGEVHIDAKSTVVIRCILSMESALQQLAALNPHLLITHDASQHDMYYMNQQDRALYRKKWTPEATKAYGEYCDRHANYMAPMGRLFNDTAWAHRNINLGRLNTDMYKLASSVQGTELGKQFSLYDIYTADELYDNWLQANAFWYIAYGSCPLNGGTQPFSQRNLLRKIIEEADSCILQSRPGATLRYGHETMVLPLTCLLGLNGFDQQVTDLEELAERGWINYRVYPMACNVQFVFYRSNPNDQDILVKVLLNENEATLPIPTDCAPYYRWSDFRDYYLRKIDAYRE